MKYVSLCSSIIQGGGKRRAWWVVVAGRVVDLAQELRQLGLVLWRPWVRDVSAPVHYNIEVARYRNASRSHPLKHRIILTFITLRRSGSRDHQPLADVLVGDVDAVVWKLQALAQRP